MFVERNRFIYTLLIITTVFLGLASRKFAAVLPKFIADYSGDTLWALMVYFGFGWLFNKSRIFLIAILTLSFSYAIEISQLYSASWLDSIRATRLGGLILGFGFLWSDLICYTVGVILGVLLEKFFLLKASFKKTK
ncbi:DUF2809 domain-containing protein [Fulvivirgaceae bacterium BMA10]|uniref:DUF2809 domain-containing protein n=1 Tax=Splendidivirga corallicola TaxID=3051826 RepID=A0ABT8KQ49_9BACT|nr:DUF2809 domain-containing protein [Fulvivirgaceae bacterium BMA10]